MKNLNDAQREGRQILRNPYLSETGSNVENQQRLEDHEDDKKALDQHTANTWKAAQEAMEQDLLDSGLLEGIHDAKLRVYGYNTLAKAIKADLLNLNKG